jgi:diguanylate cyclase (GGDEF)-like protein/PAS domain S-box-containing protein
VISRLRRARPFDRAGRGIVVAIFISFGLASAVSVTLSIVAIDRSRSRATALEVVARQRTLAERYVGEVLAAHDGGTADPTQTAALLNESVRVLLDGGVAPAAPGNDDSTRIAAVSGTSIRRQLVEQQRLIADLTAAGGAVLAGRSVAPSALTGGERLTAGSPITQLRVLAGLTSGVAEDTASAIAEESNRSSDSLITLELAIGVVGLAVTLALASVLVITTRSRMAHYRTLVTSSSDLVFVLGDGGCTYASRSLCKLAGRPQSELLGQGITELVHHHDREKLAEILEGDPPQSMLLRVRNSVGELRYLEAIFTDLRSDRHVRGLVVSSRDVTERVRLEEELLMQNQRDAFGSQIVEALEMADDEQSAYDVVGRAMIEIAPESPMELLLSDSSRAHLEPVATNAAAGAPGCPVQSPFSCIAVRRGQPVEFESSEALNACPKLRGRASGPCSATCVPVSFMGRGLGVLHATGPQGAQAGPERLAQLTVLATQAGARIGTVRAFEKTQLQAATDGLTGLVNRRTFEREVRELISSGRRFALAVGDLDHFKAVNDTYGHEAGDRALRMFAQVAQDALRDGDVIARWGGEEFVFAMPGLNRRQAENVLDRIRVCLAEAHTGALPRFTVSFGVTDSEVGATLEELMSVADAAVYQSKRAGRDRVTIGEALPAPRAASNGNGNGVPALQRAAEEEDPPASGFEIR